MTNVQGERRRPRRRRSNRRPTDSNSPAPRLEGGFTRFGLNDEVLRGVQDAGFVDPRPIQDQAIQPALDGRDVLGLAQTGTGKTAAFALPILDRLRERRGDARGPRALVVAPTRELASQIHAEFERLGQFTRVRSAVVFGGVPQGAQVKALKARPDVLVACPGRLLDLADQRIVDLSRVEILVLDEADHMFDMGFLPSVRRILKLLPERRQSLLFSATMPKEIRHLADDVLRKPAVIELAHSRPADTIEHALYACVRNRRLELLEELLAADDFRSAIVFLRTKHRARKIAKQLDARGHRAVALQGNMSQNQRVRAMEGFRAGKFDVLVATDIAARGIDVANVSHVVNFDVPNTPEAYTHRIGRTGRSESEGKAYTFASREDDDLVRAIEKHLGAKIPRRRLDGFDTGDVNALPKPKPETKSTRRGRPAPKKKPAASGGGKRRPAKKSASAAKPRTESPKAKAAPKAPAPSFGAGL